MPYSQPPLDLTTFAKADAIPQPSSTMPPGVSDSGSVGTQTGVYALANHTHAAKARKQRITGVTTFTYTWVYPTPFASGVIPICNGIAEDPTDNANDSYNLQISGVPTNTQCTFRVKRQTSGLLGLLLGAVSFNPAPGNINIHCSALEP